MSALPSLGHCPAELGLAVGMGLLSAALVSIVVALVWRFPGSMGVISPEATLVIGTVGLDFVVAVAPDRQLPTLMATVALVALALGVLLLVLARARLGYLIHYLPFPVVAGLIGGLGILLVIGGLKLAVPDLLAGGYRLAAVPPGELLATTAVGALCWLVQHRWPATFNLPLLVTAATLAFWLAPGAADRSDWLLQGFDAYDNYRAGRCLAQPDRRGLGGDRQRFPHAGDARGFPGCRRPRRRRHDGGGPGPPSRAQRDVAGIRHRQLGLRLDRRFP